MKKIFIMLLVFTAQLPAYSKKPVKAIDLRSQKQIMLEKKLRSIIIKHIQFEEAAPAAVFKYLRKISKESDPDGKGINFITSGLKNSKKRITLLLDNIPLSEVIRYVCKAADLNYKVDDFAVIIKPNQPGSKSKEK